MTKRPNVVMRGIRDRVPADPFGFVLGSDPSLGSSPGPVKLIRRDSFVSPSQAANINRTLNPPKFTAWVEGLIADNELIGQVTTSKAITFTNTSFTSNAAIPATATAVFHLYMIVSGAPTLIATITFAAGSNTGVMAFIPNSSVVVPANAQVALNGPSPADLSLANVGFSWTGQDA